MMRKQVWGFIFVALLAACSKSGAPGSPKFAESVAVAPMQAAGAAASAQTAESKRHIELRHKLVVEVPEAQLESVWRGRLAACQPPACEVVSAAIENQRGGYASANLSLRIAPAQAGSLIDTLSGVGKLAQHEMSQSDRTNEVIDIQARLANQKALRDRLRALVAGRVDKLHDLIEVERELARVQGEIDSAEGQIRATLAVTEKTSFDITFRAPASLAQPGSWEPVRKAWSNIGAVFAESLSILLMFVSAVLPWLAVFGPLCWGLRKVWRRLQAAKTQAK